MVQTSRLPASIIKCATDLPMLARYVNEAQQRLIYAMGETGAYGGWWKVVFHVCRSATRDITLLPREFARAPSTWKCAGFQLRFRISFTNCLRPALGRRTFTDAATGAGPWRGTIAGTFRVWWI